MDARSPCHAAILLLWVLWCLYWLASALRVKRTARRESLPSRLSHILPVGCGVWLIFAPLPHPAWLAAPRLPPATVRCAAAALLVALGLLCNVLARVQLGATGAPRSPPSATTRLCAAVRTPGCATPSTPGCCWRCSGRCSMPRRCARCSAWRWPPQASCTSCASRRVSWSGSSAATTCALPGRGARAAALQSRSAICTALSAAPLSS